MKKILLFLFVFFSFDLYASSIDTLRIGFNFNLYGQQFFNESHENFDNKIFQLTTFRFYISKFKINYEDGTFDTYDKIHLFDMDSIDSYVIKLPNIKYKKIKYVAFNIGLDSLITKHSNLEGTLDPINGMFWSWRAGYINYKIEGNFGKKNKLQKFIFHIGGADSEFSSVFTVQNKVPNINSIDVNIEFKYLIDFLSHEKDLNIMSINDKSYEFSKQFQKCFTQEL